MTVEAGIRRSDAHDPLKAKARAYRRSFARRARLRLDDLDALTSERLAHFARCKAALTVLDPDDDPERYLRAQNATSRALLALETRLGAVGLDAGGADPEAALRRHVAENYTDGHRSSGVAAPAVDAAAAGSPYGSDAAGRGVEGSAAAAGASS